MTRQSLFTGLFAGSALLILAACASDPEKPAVEEVEQPQPVTQSVVENPEPDPEPAPAAPAAPTLDETLLQVKTFYFDYDIAELRDIAVTALDAHAENILDRLASNPNLGILVEGHADERGTIAYNNALGNRRAEAVARYLRVKGVPGNNIDVVSYGELRPVSDKHTESAWQLNRRAVITY